MSAKARKVTVAVDIGRDAPTVETTGLRKEFDGLVAVDSLDLRIGKGLVYGMIGPNGSGKTTAIKMLVGLLRPTAGGARVLGESIPVRMKTARMGYMPQEMAVYDDISVHENLAFFAGLYSLDAESARRREEELLGMIDLKDRADSLVGHLSGGMRHRVSLACALMHDPELVFLDEPTVGVDPELRAGFWDYFTKLKEAGKTIVLTTHYMDEAVRCDVVGMMRQGVLIAEGTPAGLLERTRTAGLEDAFLAFSKEGRT